MGSRDAGPAPYPRAAAASRWPWGLAPLHGPHEASDPRALGDGGCNEDKEGDAEASTVLLAAAPRTPEGKSGCGSDADVLRVPPLRGTHRAPSSSSSSAAAAATIFLLLPVVALVRRSWVSCGSGRGQGDGQSSPPPSPSTRTAPRRASPPLPRRALRAFLPRGGEIYSLAFCATSSACPGRASAARDRLD